MLASDDEAKELVDQWDMLVAAPEAREGEQGSETWAAIRYARERNVTVVLLRP